MGKKKKQSGHFDYAYGSGEIGDLMDRYGIEGTRSIKPDNRGATPDSYNRSREDVDKDIAEAMMSDYDTRRTMEAAAMAGNKDAKKYAKKGFKAKNIYEAYDVMRDLKKEYVGGGGMRGAKNEAGLTYALVKADRENMLAGLDEKYGQKEAPKDPADDIGKKADVVLSDHLQRAKSIVDDWEQNDQQVYADNSGALTQSTGIKETEPPSDQPEPSDIPIGELDLTDPDTFYKNKMNTYSKAFNLTADF